LFLSSNTRQSDALKEVIDYGMCTLGLPVIVVYPDYSLNTSIADGSDQRQCIKDLWDNLPIFRDNMSSVPTAHVPMNKEFVMKALNDSDFSINGKTKNYRWCY